MNANVKMDYILQKKIINLTVKVNSFLKKKLIVINQKKNVYLIVEHVLRIIHAIVVLEIIFWKKIPVIVQ